MCSAIETETDWQAHHRLLFGYLRKRTGDLALAQDLCQDVLLKWHHQAQAGGTVDNPRAWLLQTAHHALIDHYRRHTRWARPLPDDAAASTEQESGAYQALSDYVRPLLRCLPDAYAEALALELDGVPQKEIAQQLRLELSATKSRIQRSRLKMQGLVHECFHLHLDAKGRIESFAVRADCRTLQAFLAEQEKN